MNKEVTVQYQDENLKTKQLIMSLFFDFIGMLSYLIPLFGEAIDVFWAPIAALMLIKMYKGSTGKVAGIIGFIEEFIPGLDFIPTFTITWFYTYKIKGKQNP
jgi:hypothetical protein